MTTQEYKNATEELRAFTAHCKNRRRYGDDYPKKFDETLKLMARAVDSAIEAARNMTMSVDEAMNAFEKNFPLGAARIEPFKFQGIDTGEGESQGFLVDTDGRVWGHVPRKGFSTFRMWDFFNDALTIYQDFHKLEFAFFVTYAPDDEDNVLIGGNILFWGFEIRLKLW